MAKRFLDCTTSDFVNFSKTDYLSSIAGSEGRVIACECIGITMPLLVDVTNAELVSYAHSLGALTITAIGTSQEGADTATIRQIALLCKMAGTDIHHIGDIGYPGAAIPENIMAYSIAIRGVRHTYHRMAASVNR